MILDKTENQSFWAPNFELLIIKNECGFSASHVPHVLFLSIRCPLCADFVAEVAEEESGRWRRAINLACHSPVRGVAGDYSNDCQRDFGMT